MGSGIGLVTAVHSKLNVLLVDQSAEQLKKAMDLNKKLLDKDVGKQRLSADDAAAALKRFRTSTSLGDLSGADFVVEAVSENLDLKKKIFKDLSSATRPDVILATNTSSISITKLQNSAITSKSDKVLSWKSAMLLTYHISYLDSLFMQIIGMHFMNPVPVMKLVEVITGLRTSTSTLDTTLVLAASMGKTTTKSNDVPGFIANRLLMPYINEAIVALETGIGSKEDIDTTMKLGCNMPMGPLRLADFIGLDTCLAIMQVLHRDLGDSKYRPSPLLQKYVDAGLLGNKTKEGFYKYDA